MPVYVIAFKGEESEVVKIGWSIRPSMRMRSHQTSNHKKVVVLRTIDTPQKGETWMKRHFRAYRVRGEWFRFTPEMLTVVPDVPEDDAPYISAAKADRPEHWYEPVRFGGPLLEVTPFDWSGSGLSPDIEIERRITDALRAAPKLTEWDIISSLGEADRKAVLMFTIRDMGKRGMLQRLSDEHPFCWRLSAAMELAA